jgi:phage protein D
MAAAKYKYESLKEQYSNFQYPMAKVTVNGKDFSENSGELVLSDLEIDLSTGFEASVAEFSIFNTFDRETGTYLFSKFKDYVALGSCVLIELGYSGRMTQVFTGFISSVRFANTREMPHHVEVTAMDVKGMMMSGRYERQLAADSYGKAVQEIFSGELYQKLQAEGIFTKLQVTGTPDQTSQDKPINRTIEMVSESDYEFVVKAAKRFNYEFYIDAGTVCFRKAKQTAESLLMELQNADGVLNYEITYDMTGLVKKVEVRGVDIARGNVVTATNSVSNKISRGTKAKSLINHTKKVVVDANAVSKELAQQRADSIMEETAYRFGSLTCECIGMPELMPGHFITLSDIGEPGDASFYITHARHVLNDYDGYHTYITAKAASLS